MRTIARLAALWGLTLALGCGGGDIGDTCENPDDCSSGLTCYAWPCLEGASCVFTCEQECTMDEECNGRTCSGGLCIVTVSR